MLPGLGQALNRRPRLALVFLIPSLIVLGVAVLMWLTQSPTGIAAWAVSPPVMGTLLTLNLLLLAWRLLAMFQAFLDTRLHGPTSRVGVIGLIVLTFLVVLPHVFVYSAGSALSRTFDKVFSGSTLGTEGSPAPAPAFDQRLNVLLVGVDSLPNRSSTLTDTMMVVSLDPVGKTVSMVSLPRDLIGVPLGNGDTYGPKLNSLYAYAEAHAKDFPQGGMRALEDAVGALLDIHIDYYARMEFDGLIKMVDAVDGVYVDVKDAFDDPTYDGYGRPYRGFKISTGLHHFNGPDALAYARSRKAVGETDFARAARQQEILLALRRRVMESGTLLFHLPDLLTAVGDTVKTDLPQDRLPQLAAIADQIGKGGITRAVINHPLVRSKATIYGSSLIPDIPAIQAVAAKLFPAPGTKPIPWPTPKPKPTKAPSTSASPSAAP